MSGFGRKGLAVHQSRRDAVAARDAEMPAKREAFVASERANRAAGTVDAHSSETIGYHKPTAKRSMTTAYLCWLVLGQISMHRFYIGARESALYQVSLFVGGLIAFFVHAPLGLALLAGWVIWIFADLFLIPGLLREYSG